MCLCMTKPAFLEEGKGDFLARFFKAHQPAGSITIKPLSVFLLMSLFMCAGVILPVGVLRFDWVG